jgi:hypothetical protein
LLFHVDGVSRWPIDKTPTKTSVRQRFADPRQAWWRPQRIHEEFVESSSKG